MTDDEYHDLFYNRPHLIGKPRGFQVGTPTWGYFHVDPPLQGPADLIVNMKPWVSKTPHLVVHLPQQHGDRDDEVH